MLRRLRAWLRSAAGSTPATEADPLAGVREWIDVAITGGFDPYPTIRDSIVEIAADDGVSPETAERLLQERWDARLAEQQSWTTPSDADRLAAAFEDLNSDGVLARMGFSCCGTCGPGELFEIRDAEDPQQSYAYFHVQDAEGVGDGCVFLGYGSFVDTRELPDPDRAYERLALAVGEQVRSTLTRHGLEVVWDGSLARRIRVELPDWRKPLAPR
jgi:hypothetical protein